MHPRIRAPALALAALAAALAGCHHAPPGPAGQAGPASGTAGVPNTTPLPADQSTGQRNNPVAPPEVKGSGQLPDSGTAHDTTARDSTLRDSTARDTTPPRRG